MPKGHLATVALLAFGVFALVGCGIWVRAGSSLRTEPDGRVGGTLGIGGAAYDTKLFGAKRQGLGMHLGLQSRFAADQFLVSVRLGAALSVGHREDTSFHLRLGAATGQIGVSDGAFAYGVSPYLELGPGFRLSTEGNLLVIFGIEHDIWFTDQANEWIPRVSVAYAIW